MPAWVQAARRAGRRLPADWREPLPDPAGDDRHPHPRRALGGPLAVPRRPLLLDPLPLWWWPARRQVARHRRRRPPGEPPPPPPGPPGAAPRSARHTN